jgi:hypothetical protein
MKEVGEKEWERDRKEKGSEIDLKSMIFFYWESDRVLKLTGKGESNRDWEGWVK